MKLFVPIMATAALAVCVGASGLAWSQTTENSSSQTTTTSAMAPAAVTKKTTTVTAPATTSETTTSTANMPAQPSMAEENHTDSTTYGPLGNKTVTHDSSTTNSP